MKKTVIKRRKRIVPTNYISGGTTPQSHYGRRPSTSSNSLSPPPSHSHHSHSPRVNYGPLPPLWAGHPGRTSQSYSPEPQDFTNYRYNTVTSPKFPPSYSEQNTLPPIRLPLVTAHPQSLSPPPLVPSIQHVGNAIPLPKRPHDSPESAAKRLRPMGSLLPSTVAAHVEDIDPLEGARALLALGSRESVIRKRAELIGEIDVFSEKLDKLKRAVTECDEFLGKA